jgi:ketosteroid isomerase-like protein
MMQQARWIDPRPLAHERTRLADSAEKTSFVWSQAIVDAAGVDRVCPLTDANERCRGLAGGILRLSRPDAAGSLTARGADSVLVYVRWEPLNQTGDNEIEFFLVREAARWRIISKRTLPAIRAGAPRAEVVDPKEALDSLLATDRRFGLAAQTTDLVTALTNMFVDNVVMQAPGGHVRGRAAAEQTLRSVADNARSRVEWAPVHAGVSSDGTHGFTLGYMSMKGPDGIAKPAKYLAYWVRAESGWRVAAYKRVLRAAGEPPAISIAPSLPSRALPRGNPEVVQRYADELSLAEHAFSKDALYIGLGPAFEKWGAADAVNLGGPANSGIVVGPGDIARLVTSSIPEEMGISWAPEQVIVAPTGDLGVSIGTIKLSTPAAEGRPASTREVPFFTIWKRAWPTDPWRYVAE